MSRSGELMVTDLVYKLIESHEELQKENERLCKSYESVDPAFCALEKRLESAVKVIKSVQLSSELAREFLQSIETGGEDK